MSVQTVLLPVAVLALRPTPGPSAEPVLPLHVLYVGKAGSDRAVDYGAFLKKNFRKVSVAGRVGFDPAAAKAADVVLLDWSQDESRVGEAKSPFGKLEDWSRPTVLLGSAGLLLAAQWDLIGGAG